MLGARGKRSRWWLEVLLVAAAVSCGSEADVTTSTSPTTTTSTTIADQTTTSLVTTEPASTEPLVMPIQLVPGGNLAGYPVGTDAETVIGAVTALFGAPTTDLGWNVGCPLDGEDVVNERFMAWGSLRVYFYGEPDSGYMRAFVFHLDRDTELAAVGGPGIEYVETPSGVLLGQSISDTGDALGVSPSYSEMFDSTVVELEGVVFRAYGPDPDGTLIAGEVPSVPICE